MMIYQGDTWSVGKGLKSRFGLQNVSVNLMYPNLRFYLYTQIVYFTLVLFSN